MTREVCKKCGRENPLGFLVPDEIWAAAVPEEYREKVLCILCFDEFATQAGVEWDRYPISFFPVSGAGFRRWLESDDSLTLENILRNERERIVRVLEEMRADWVGIGPVIDEAIRRVREGSA